MLAPLGATVAVVSFVAVALPGSTAGLPVAVVVFPAVAFNVPVSLAPMLAPLGATVAVVSLVPPAFTAERWFVVVAFCGKQSDCVAFVPPPAGPTDAPPGAGVAA